ncbi:hypothetical protein EV191_109223 [Tamaricihabitans halophyticus]|uniref:Uncharacterized protein n=1 Tax=Tamaricihabitans halophyticus TaxID=1262583 RepID=A0A4R2QQS6_9PSEU|nr:hypothetical protein [Tamaricihabitans halophyticus]TCP49401.1 hypothetical protein EV191_109223 [Tamaricihabitans halophyticus]
MDSGQGSAPEQEPRRARHRRGATAGTWTPTVPSAGPRRGQNHAAPPAAAADGTAFGDPLFGDPLFDDPLYGSPVDSPLDAAYPAEASRRPGPVTGGTGQLPEPEAPPLRRPPRRRGVTARRRTESATPVDTDHAALDPPTRPHLGLGPPEPAWPGAADLAAAQRPATDTSGPPAHQAIPPQGFPETQPPDQPAGPVDQPPEPADAANAVPAAIAAASSAEGGLAKFDLGTVPASVTPPRSWRRAAWFAVASSTGVAALLLAAGTLVSQPSSRILDAAPNGYEHNNPFPYPADTSPDGLTSSTERTERGESSAPETRDTTPTTVDDRARTDSFGSSQPTGQPSTGSPGSGSGSGEPGPSTSAPVTGEPESSTRNPGRPPSPPPNVETNTRGFAKANADKMADNTRDYYYYVTEDPQAAHALTTGAESAEDIERRYADVSYIVVREIVVNPDEPTTENTIEVTRTDGTKTTEVRTLEYSYGNDPKVAVDR